MFPLEYIVPALLTLVVYTYLVGDNPAYRVAQHLFVGVSVGLATLAVVYNVLWPQLVFLSLQKDTYTIFTEHILLLAALLLGLILLAKVVLPRNAGSNSVLGIIVGVGAATALGGALIGTLVPQTLATMVPLTGAGNGDIPSILGNIVLVVGVVATLSYFYFTARKDGTRGQAAQAGATVGRYFIMVAFGAIFGLLTISFFAALYGRVDFLAGPFR